MTQAKTRWPGKLIKKKKKKKKQNHVKQIKWTGNSKAEGIPPAFHSDKCVAKQIFKIFNLYPKMGDYLFFLLFESLFPMIMALQLSVVM